MLILSSISSGLEFWSVNHSSIYKKSESKVFKNITFQGEISNKWPNDLFERTTYKILEPCWYTLLTLLQCTNTTAVISKSGIFSPFSYFIILLLDLPSNFVVSGVENWRYYPVLILNVILFSILFTYIF